MCSYYFANIKSVKWYKNILLYGIEVCMVNALRLYNSFSKGKKMQLFDFRMKVIEKLAEPIIFLNSSPAPCLSTLCGNLNTHRLKGKHFIEKLEKNDVRRCIFCKIRRSTYRCDICKFTLCIEDCFRQYHTKTDLFQ